MKRILPKDSFLFSGALVLSCLFITCGNRDESGESGKADRFETVRTNIQSWLSHTDPDSLIMSSSIFKEKIVDDWDTKNRQYQIVSVRWPEHYESAGRIPGAINIYWPEIILDENMARLDINKTIVLYCYYGHGSMICCTILGLAGYNCRSLNFGMMDWNVDALVKPAWDREADYEIEMQAADSQESYGYPVILSGQSDPPSVILEMSRNYFAGEGSPVISSSDLNNIIDDWEMKSAQYQIVDIRPRAEYRKGHIPHSVNIPFLRIAHLESLRKLDPDKIIIAYCENGQKGQLASTLLNLLGYRAVALKFGMMDWNKSYVEETLQWDGTGEFPVSD